MLEIIAEEVVSVDISDVEVLRSRLQLLAARQRPEPVSHVEQLLQSELHAYREAAEKKIHRLRQDLAGTADALQEYITRFSSRDVSQEGALNTALHRLSSIRQLTDLQQIRVGIDLVRETVSTSIQELKAQNFIIVTQLRDEIRTLQQRLDGPRSHEATEGTLANRAIFERRIRTKVNRLEIFSMYVIRVTNWKEVVNLHEQEEVQSLSTSVSHRLTGFLGADTFTGRWYEGYFAAIVGLDKRTAMEGASDLAQQIAGIYHTGHKPVVLHIRVAVVDHIPGQDADQTLKRVDQLIRAFEG